jgi:hypothetical protein
MAEKDVQGNTYTLPHFCRGRSTGGPRLIDTRLVYEGSLDYQNLKKFIAISKDTDSKNSISKDYRPDEDLRILNLISWRNINEREWNGGRVGSKFYPADQESKALYGRDNDILYNLRVGFFSSMRPAHGSLLLNINSTTSAFFAPSNLQTWLQARYGFKDQKMLLWQLSEAVNELKQVRVKFLGDEKTRQISGFLDKTVSEETFVKGGRKISVFDHMKTRKLHYSLFGTS